MSASARLIWLAMVGVGSAFSRAEVLSYITCTRHFSTYVRRCSTTIADFLTTSCRRERRVKGSYSPFERLQYTFLTGRISVSRFPRVRYVCLEGFVFRQSRITFGFPPERNGKRMARLLESVPLRRLRYRTARGIGV